MLQPYIIQQSANIEGIAFESLEESVKRRYWENYFWRRQMFSYPLSSVYGGGEVSTILTEWSSECHTKARKS